MEEQGLGTLVEELVDVQVGMMAVDAEPHAGEEALLLEHASTQQDLWGINIYYGMSLVKTGSASDSMVNASFPAAAPMLRRPETSRTVSSGLVKAHRDSVSGAIPLVPSFFGAVTWGFWLVFYQARLIGWDPSRPEAVALFWTVESCYLASLLFFTPLMWRWIVAPAGFERARTTGQEGIGSRPLLLACHLIGFVGVSMDVVHLAPYFGGLSGFLRHLISDPIAIRLQGLETTSLGTQISYFGWVAIALSVFEYRRKRLAKPWIVLAFLQLLGNLVFIDRTRPMWILFTAVLMALPTARLRPTVVKSLWIGLLATAAAVAVFVGIGKFIGKVYGEELLGRSMLPPSLQTTYYYGTCGFAYFNEIIQAEQGDSALPERTFYPVMEILSRVGLGGAPPSQVNEFYRVPFPTNVGTALEPFYRDGGLGFTLLGIVLMTFGVDLVGLVFLRMRSGVAVFAWANLCFASFMAFFTPKLNNTPLWLFCGLGVIGGLILPAMSSRGRSGVDLAPRRKRDERP